MRHLRLALETGVEGSHAAGSTAAFGPLSAGSIDDLAGRYVSGKSLVLLTEPIEVRAQGVGSKVLLPEPGREEMDLKGGVGVDPWSTSTK
jgi:hypothetical protein